MQRLSVGLYVPASIHTMVWRVQPAIIAKSSWLISFSTRAILRFLFFIRFEIKKIDQSYCNLYLTFCHTRNIESTNLPPSIVPRSESKSQRPQPHEQMVGGSRYWAVSLDCTRCASLLVDRHVSHSLVECDSTGNPSKDSPTAPECRKLTGVQTLASVNSTDLFLRQDIGGHSLTKDVKVLSRSRLQTLAPLRGQNKVRTFWEHVVNEVEIPIYDIPATKRVGTH